jgi:hypothetical protein
MLRSPARCRWRIPHLVPVIRSRCDERCVTRTSRRAESRAPAEVVRPAGAGATGCILGLVLQWYTNAVDLPAWFIVPVRGYAFMISGKPFWSLPANIPVIFELTVLLSAITAVFGMLILNGLPRLFKSKRFLRATDDRFFVVIEARDPKFYREKTERFLESLSPIAVEAVED